MTATTTAATYQAIIDRYVMLVKRNGPDAIAAVLHDIEDGEGGIEVTYELLEVTWDMDLRSQDESDTTVDAWWDACRTMLPKVAEALA